MNSQQFHDWLEQMHQSPSCIVFKKPLVMGILNTTSDSFFDGGKFLSFDKACEHAFKLIEQGADIIDIGGESSRPGARHIAAEFEMTRVIPVIEQIRRQSDVCISIDTYKPEIMKAAVKAGANIINDIYALQHDGALSTAAQLGVPVCLMHMQGQPQTMQDNPFYPNGVMTDVVSFFSRRIEACIEMGIDKRLLILDPGFGFGKQVQDNLNLIYHLNELKLFNLPLLLGVSRKSTIGALLNKEVDDRLIGSIALSVYAATKGVGMLRTHDVDETKQALCIIEAIYQSG